MASLEFFFAGMLLPARLPIGLEPVIKTADRPLFSDFYDTWYRPERLAVVAIGDFATEAAKKPLVELFSPLTARAPARPTPDYGTPAPRAEAVTFGHHHEAEASATSVAIQVVILPDLRPDTAEKRVRELPLQLAYSMLNRRLSELAKAESAPFVRASVSRDAFPGVFDGAGLDLVARPGQWAEALRVGENELRRALRFGFRGHELREASAGMRNALEQAAKTDPTRRSEERADTLVDAFIEGTVPTTPAADLALLGPALAAVTPEDCHEALKAAWSSTEGRLVGVYGNTNLGDTDAARAAIARAYAAAEAVEVTAPPERADTPWAYENFGPAGTVVSRREVADLGITQVVFANGVRLNLRRTDFEAGVIAVRARVGAGKLIEPRDRPGLAFFAGAAFTSGGLGKHSDDELRRILAGRNVGVGLQVADDALAFVGQTTPADLALQLQLLAAYLADPGYRTESELTARRFMEPYYARLATDPSGPLNLQVPKILSSGDTRFGVPAHADALARNLEELRAWLTPQLASGPVELALVGDLDVDAAVAAVAATLGALPAREPKPDYEELRRVVTAKPGDTEIKITSSVTKTILAYYWPTADARDAFRVRRLNLLADIFSDRLRRVVREELGGSYSPGAGSMPSDTYRDYGFILARVTLDPAEAERVRPAILAAAADLAKNGVSEDELNRSRLPVLTELRESARTNAYWLNSVLADAQERPERLERARDRQADYESITKADLDALASAYLAPERAIRFTISAAPGK